MPREALVLTIDPIRLIELGQVIQHRSERLGVQGIDRGGSAAILRPNGRIVCAVQAPVRLETIDELIRLRPDAPHDVPVPCYWHDAWIGQGEDSLGIACLEALARVARGTVVLWEPLADAPTG